MTIAGWLDSRLGVERFRAKYLGKPFPEHSTFFLGEIALFCFIMLVGTGMYLALVYEPSAQSVSGGSGTMPLAYASVVAIDSHPFGALVRRMHHWAGQLMIASIVLHLLRIYFTASYRQPREVNWLLGLVLLGATIGTSFAGYLLPYDQFSVTATAIGYGIARSIPWIGPLVADYGFAGAFPSPSSVPRFFAYHVVWAPLVLSGLIALHLVILLKHKHTEPAHAKAARAASEAHLIEGVPLWPQQTALMAVLFLVVIAVTALLSAFLPVHPVTFYGPPSPLTPEVKPDWYLLWVYGALRLIPGDLSFHVLGATIGSEAIGAMLLPGILSLAIVLTPWLDRSPASPHFAESPTASPTRLAFGLAAITLFLALSLAGFGEELGLSVPVLWAITLATPLLVWWVAYLLAGRWRADGA